MCKNWENVAKWPVSIHQMATNVQKADNQLQLSTQFIDLKRMKG